MKTIIKILPKSIEHYEPELNLFIKGMVIKLEKNAHKSTPQKCDIEGILKLLFDEVEEFRQQVKENKFDENALLELCDVANFAFLSFVALQHQKRA